MDVKESKQAVHPLDFKAIARKLKDEGVAVLKLLEKDELIYWHERMLEYEKTIPEMLHPEDPEARACIGGFGALGEASSFWHPFVLELRERVASIVFHILAEYEVLCLAAGESMHYIALMPDRLSIRYQGTKTSSESVHRDNCPGLHMFDRVFGSFINLNLPGDKPQQFNCINRSHILTEEELKQMRSHSGFAAITNKEEKKAAKQQMTTHDISSGELILFHAHMLHEVKATTCKKTSRRAYNGFQFTTRPKFLHARNNPLSDPEGAFAEQAILRLPSGQMPPMYAKMHRNQYLHKVTEALGDTLPNLCKKTFVPSLLETHMGTWEETPEKPREYTLVKRLCPSMREQGHLYPAMTEQQKAILVPSRAFEFFNICLPAGEEDEETDTDDEAAAQHKEEERKAKLAQKRKARQEKKEKKEREKKESPKKRRKISEEEASEKEEEDKEEEKEKELPHKKPHSPSPPPPPHLPFHFDLSLFNQGFGLGKID